MTTRCPNCKQTIGRSRAEHDTLFGVIGMAFENWPEKHRFQPLSIHGSGDPCYVLLAGVSADAFLRRHSSIQSAGNAGPM